MGQSAYRKSNSSFVSPTIQVQLFCSKKNISYKFKKVAQYVRKLAVKKARCTTSTLQSGWQKWSIYRQLALPAQPCPRIRYIFWPWVGLWQWWLWLCIELHWNSSPRLKHGTFDPESRVSENLNSTNCKC